MNVSNFDKNMSAVAFAEAGEFETARGMLHNETAQRGNASQPARGAAPLRKKKPYLPAIGFGLVSISLYVILFSNEQLVTNTFTMGGWYTVLPVGGAFLFSFIHGAFASNLLNVLGLEAKK
ncbi:MAG: hypothetical protein A2521_10055 [Deltaproteobacteria bacterium RIFOXYD12_FULL_57_12]|nr:MAG: hypothetical protein A2521_10055 [Deltaproteobacteria bacterium RIFOXYD12_FULL_57_12]